MAGAGAEPRSAQQVGNEFGSVEALWSQFENVMAKEEGGGGGGGEEEEEVDAGEGEEGEGEGEGEQDEGRGDGRRG